MAFRIAFERAGGKCVFSSDWDKFSRQTYEANFGEEPKHDIYDVDIAKIPDFEILCAGFPCQPFSLAGVSKKNSLGRKHGFECEKQGNLFFKIGDTPEKEANRIRSRERQNTLFGTTKAERGKPSGASSKTQRRERL